MVNGLMLAVLDHVWSLLCQPEHFLIILVAFKNSHFFNLIFEFRFAIEHCLRCYGKRLEEEDDGSGDGRLPYASSNRAFHIYIYYFFN